MREQCSLSVYTGHVAEGKAPQVRKQFERCMLQRRDPEEGEGKEAMRVRGGGGGRREERERGEERDKAGGE